jgi:hypothetical protein
MNSCTISLVFACLLLAGVALAGADDTRIRESPFRQGEFEVLRNERRAESVRPDPFREGEYRIFDRNEKPIGRVRPDPFREGEWRVEPEGSGD